MDRRIKIVKRQIVIDIDDETPIDFSDKDQEEIAEQIEYLLQNNYAVKVTNIEIKKVQV